MGIYGLQTWGDYYAKWLMAELRSAQERQGRMRARMQFARELLEAASPPDGPVELMACPGCETRFHYGSVCPHCGAELVCESFLAGIVPSRPRSEPWGLTAARWVGFGVLSWTTCIALTTLFFLGWPYHSMSAAALLPAPGSAGGPVSTVSPVEESLDEPQRLAVIDSGLELAPLLWVEVEPVDWRHSPELHLVAPGGVIGGVGDCNIDTCTSTVAPLDWGIAGSILDDPQMWGFSGEQHGAWVLLPAQGTYRITLLPGGTTSEPTSDVHVRIGTHHRILVDETLGTYPSTWRIGLPSGDVLLQEEEDVGQ